MKIINKDIEEKDKNKESIPNIIKIIPSNLASPAHDFQFNFGCTKNNIYNLNVESNESNTNNSSYKIKTSKK